MRTKLIRNPDTSRTIAIVALVGAVGYGVYSWLKGRKVEPAITVTNVTIEKK